MGDNYFNGTLDDFYDDPTFWDLAQSALSLGSPPPFGQAPAPQAWPSHGIPPIGVGAQSQSNSPAHPSALGGVWQQNGPSLDVFGGGFAAEPTHAASMSSHRLPQAASWRPEPIRLSASSGNPETHALQRNASVHQIGSFTTTPTPRHPTTFPSSVPAHSISNQRQNPSGSSVPNSASSVLNQRLNIPPSWTNRNQSNQDFNLPGVAGFADQLTARRAIATANNHSLSTPIPAMSSNPRRGGARSADATAPLTPAQPAQSAGPTTRTPRRSASRTAQAGPSKRKREDDLDDLFGDGDLPGNPVVDLVDKEEIPAEILQAQEEKKNYVKLSTFDCVICMDNAKTLTVTHCGHMFCAECLDTALNMQNVRQQRASTISS
ncbi:hypothetical protein B0J18DRAFT_175814 [Chaetomium sp. MPI-SDFR-AT-0129]|nr:hypothetical protein B0J18DRAFT_175814 [Chaetomium sp. MPI-SDFR-AT-0129]